MTILRRFSDDIYPEWMQPELPPTGPPRISGTAMPGGVFMSTGNARSAGDLSLILTGMSIALLGSGALVLTWVTSWLVEQFSALPLTEMLMMLSTGPDGDSGPMLEIGLNLLTFLCFLVLMRVTPLSGYHAAEHKVIAAIEHFGEPTMERARAMPRAHVRCGSNLLAGLLPLLLIGEPLWRINPVAGAAVIIVGWSMRFYTGYVIQALFATKEPTDHQLRAGLEAGRAVLERWRQALGKPVPPLVNLWRRGMAQMFVGMFIGVWLIGHVYEYLHLWLDF
jgi:uncharacterized protein YqhQ